MAYRELELTLLSAQELKSVNLIRRMDVYAVVSIFGDPLTRQCTAPDTYGGRNPCWNATFRFAVPSSAAAAAGASLHVLLRAERFLGDRDVGEVVIPLSDILADATGVGPQPPKVASYQVQKVHRWESRGVLNVSYRLGPVVAPVLNVSTPAPPSTNAKSNGLSQPGPVNMGRQIQVSQTQISQTWISQAPSIIFSGGAPTTAVGPPTRMTTPAGSIVSPAGKKRDGNLAIPHDTQGSYATAAESISVSVASPRSSKEDRWRPSVMSQSQSQSQHDTQQQQAASSSGPVAAPPSHRLAASPFSSRRSSFSSQLSPYSSAHPSPSPSSSAHSSTRSPYSYSAHPSTATCPHPPLTHGTNNNSFRSTSHGAAISSPLPSSSPMVPNHSRGAVSSPLPLSSPPVRNQLTLRDPPCT